MQATSGGRLNRFLSVVSAVLVVAILCGGVVLLMRLRPGVSSEITITEQQPSLAGARVMVDGNVSGGGLYPVKDGDTIATVLQSAGVQPDADMANLRLYVPKVGEAVPAQKVNINTAEAWMLQVLPGIGPSKAEAIVKYRSDNGQFHQIEDLMKVEGIGRSTFEKLRPYLTVSS